MRQLGACAGLAPTPYSSGDSEREQGISDAWNRRVRCLMIELSWLWLRYQPNSALSQGSSRNALRAGQQEDAPDRKRGPGAEVTGCVVALCGKGRSAGGGDFGNALSGAGPSGFRSPRSRVAQVVESSPCPPWVGQSTQPFL
ncbi:MAG: transposase [Methylococcales bacterium]